MTQGQFYAEFESIIEAPAGSLNGDDELANLNGWDSMAGIALIALFDSEFGITVSGSDLRACKRVGDIVKLADGKVA